MTPRKRSASSTAVSIARPPTRSPEVCLQRRAGASARVIRNAADRTPCWPSAPAWSLASPGHPHPQSYDRRSAIQNT